MTRSRGSLTMKNVCFLYLKVDKTLRDKLLEAVARYGETSYASFVRRAIIKELERLEESK